MSSADPGGSPHRWADLQEMFGEGKMPSQPETKIVDQESNKVIILNIDMKLIPKMKLDEMYFTIKYWQSICQRKVQGKTGSLNVLHNVSRAIRSFLLGFSS